MKKRACIALAGVMALSLIVPPGSYAEPEGDTTETSNEYEASLLEQGFPESYVTLLSELHEKHPQWQFEAYQTGLTWQEVIAGEMAYRTNMTPNTTSYPTSYHATSPVDGHVTFDYASNAFVVTSSPYWVQASQEAVAYYMDPRNFLNEQDIFQFEKQTYSSEVQTLEGVEKILQGTFMEDTYVINPSLLIEDGYVSGFEIGTTREELEALLICSEDTYLQIWNADGTVKASDAVVGTGDYVTVANGVLEGDTSDEEAPVATRYKTYTCLLFGDLNGDGDVNAIDYLYYKRHVLGYVELTGDFLKAAEVTFDEELTILDRLYIKRQAYGYYPLTQRKEMDGETATSGSYALWGADGVTYAKAFMQIGQELNVSPYMLAARVRQEQGTGGNSSLISGTYEGYEGYYNYFNVKAAGTTSQEIIVNGLTYAKEQGWDTRYASLEGGSKRISENYIAVGQDTLYFQKFNVIQGNGYALYKHQYMQNLLAAKRESINMKNTYTLFGCLENAFVFRIPVYLDMPETVMEPTADGNPNPYLYSLEVSGGEISPNFSKDTLDYEMNVSYDITEVIVQAQAIANVLQNASSCGAGGSEATIEGIGQHELEVGENELSVVVTAANGATLTYRIQIIREENPEVTEPSTEATEPSTEETETSAEDTSTEGEMSSTESVFESETEPSSEGDSTLTEEENETPEADVTEEALETETESATEALSLEAYTEPVSE